MPEFTLQDIRDAVDKKYGPAIINLGEGVEPAVLLPTARLSDDKLDEMKGLVSQFNYLQESAKALQANAQDESDMEAAKQMIDAAKQQRRDAVAALENAFSISARTTADAERLIRACEHDVLLLSAVFAEYQKTAQVGEASASPDTSETTAGLSPTTSNENTD